MQLFLKILFYTRILVCFGSTLILIPSFGPVPNVILCSGASYHLWYYRLGMVLYGTISRLSFGYGTIWNNISARYHCNNIAVTTTNADISAKCNTIVHDNNCGTECNTIFWLWVSRVGSRLWLCRKFLGLNPACGCAKGFQGRILRLKEPNEILSLGQLLNEIILLAAPNAFPDSFF